MTFAAQGQEYLANEPIWLQHSVCGVPAPCIANDGFNYFTAGDSVIDGVTWTRVLRAGVVTLNWQSMPPPQPGCSGTTPYGTGFHGAWLIRQQERQLRIWVDDADQLLHEFDLVVGQTLPLSFTNWNEDISVVAVDSVLIGTAMRARYELGNSWAQYLIEGVGSSHGLFEPLSNFFDCGYTLDCFGLGAEGYYPQEWEGSCAVVMRSAPADAPRMFSVAPNPTHGDVLIAGLRPGSQVTLSDATGRTVLAQRSTAEFLRLDVSALPAGCYVVTSDGHPAHLCVAH